MFYRPGGSAGRINAQYDQVYTDQIGGATAWLPINEGFKIAVNIARASIVFGNSAASAVTPSPIAPEVQVLMERKMFGGDPDAAAIAVNQWQNEVIATTVKAQAMGWVRLRVVNINNSDGTGVLLALQISKNGDANVGV
jgi:hypothetical protein